MSAVALFAGMPGAVEAPGVASEAAAFVGSSEKEGVTCGSGVVMNEAFR